MNTDRIDNEQGKLFEEQKRYRKIMDNLDMSYFEWNPQGEHYLSEKFSEYLISKYPLDDIVKGRFELDIFHDEDIPAFERMRKEAASGAPKVEAVLRLKMKDGSYRWTQLSLFFEYNEAGRIENVSGVLREANTAWQLQRKQLQKALDNAEKANRAKTDFLSRVSHDMRTPLNGILGLTSLLQDYVDDPIVRKDLYQLDQSGRYLLNLINDTLDVSKIESGNLELHPVVCDGRRVFNNVVSLANPSVKKKEIDFRVHAENLPFTMLYLDVGRMEQIIMNIIGNAVKFTPEGGTIDFTMENLSIENNIITDRITVLDSGIGMSKEFIPHLFEPFTQERNTSTSSSQGTGLGMAITKQIIEMMGGSIEVESEEGIGTKFMITLPFQIATEEQIAEWEMQQDTDMTIHILENKRILVCEDHPLNAQIAKRILESKGMIVDCAENGKLGIEMLEASEQNYYDAILMDIRMPVMNGIDAAKMIRHLDREDAKTIPIIAMTANAFHDDIQKTAKAGMNAHLSKPIEKEKLFKTLGELIKNDSKVIRPKILVVDDIEVNRVVVREAIIRHYEVLEAESGRQAIEILKNTRGIDAIITDIQMPEMDGKELIAKIRNELCLRKIAIIANTQYGSPEQEEELLEIGADDFVYKPTTAKILENRLRNVLRKR